LRLIYNLFISSSSKKNKMKKINTLFISLLFISTMILSNQTKAQSCPWAKSAGGTNEDYGAAIATDASGNVYYLGNFYSQSVVFGTATLHNQAYQASEYGAEIFLVKYDSCGNFVWAKEAGGDFDAHGTCITIDATGNIYIGGYFNCDTLHLGAVNLLNVGGSYNAFVAKYNSSGVAQWAQGGSGDAQNYVRAIVVDASSNVYITGSYASDAITFSGNSIVNATGSGTNDVFIAKFDNTGTFQWLKANTSNSATSGDAIAYGIGTDASGNVYVGGMFGSDYIRFGIDSLANNGYNDIFVVKYNTNGTLQWLKSAGGSDDDQALGLASDGSGNVYITGHIGSSTTASFGGTHTITNANQSLTTFVAKYNNAGITQWAVGSMSDDYTTNVGNDITLDASGNPYIIGYFSSDSLGLGAVTLYNNAFYSNQGVDDSMDIFVAKYKASGSLSWARSTGNTGNDYGYGIATGLNNSVYITGEFDSPTISFAGITLTVTPGSIAGDGDAFIANNISTSPITPSICEVSTDSLSLNNYIYWDNTYPSASAYVLYREVTSGVYKAIGSQPSNVLSQFVDTARSIGPANGDPNVTTYRYKLQVVDTAGTASLLSPYHNTVYFTNSGGGTFNWNLYSVENLTVTPVTQYDLMRDNLSNGNWLVVASTAGTQQTLTDPAFGTYSVTASWRVDGEGFNCNSTLRLAGGSNSPMAARVVSHSNSNNNRSAGIKLVSGNADQVQLYPNPNNGSFVIETNATEKQTIQIFDVTGKIVLTQYCNGKTNIDASSLNEGVYNISIIGSEAVLNKRMVIVR
jgi:type IX secretion system substrate protein